MPKNKSTGEKKEVKALPTWTEQITATEAALKPFRDLLPEVEKLLPPQGAALGSDAMNNAPSELWRKAVETLRTVFNRATGRTNKDKSTTASFADKDRKAIIDALKTFRDTFAAYDAHVAQMGDEVGLASLSKLPDTERTRIAAMINTALAKAEGDKAA